MAYKLLAVDMDGTLLNSKKEITKENIRMITHALKEGNQVVMCSGRCLSEMEEYFPLFPGMRYVICESGADVYDIVRKESIARQMIPPAYVKEVLKQVHDRDVMVQIMAEGRNILSKRSMGQLDYYHMEAYREHFNRTGVFVEDSADHCASSGWLAGKICLYHKNREEREQTKELISDLPLVLIYSEETSLEVSPMSIDKGVGLSLLCRHLDIPSEEVIAIGDFYNDIPMLEKAGLAVAMGNAIEPVKEICHVTTADCDHSGVAEVIKEYLLKEGGNEKNQNNRYHRACQ